MSDGVYRISDVPEKEIEYIPTQFGDFDAVYGGGFPRGVVSLWSGEQGVGKSRLVIELCKHVNRQGYTVLVFQNEVSPQQFKHWISNEAHSDQFLVSDIDDIDKQVATILEWQPDLVVVDSVNMLKGFNSSKGIRRIMKQYKQTIEKVNAHLVLVGHLNGEGDTKGNTDLPHLADIECKVFSHKEYKERLNDQNVHYLKFPLVRQEGNYIIYPEIPGIFFLQIGKNRHGKKDGWISCQHWVNGVKPMNSSENEAMAYKRGHRGQSKRSYVPGPEEPVSLVNMIKGIFAPFLEK